MIRGIRAVDGNLIAGTAQTDLLTLWLHHSSGNESKPYYVGRVEFTPEEMDTYYIVAGAHPGYIGTYEVSVEEVLFVRFPSQDFNNVADDPQGLWSDGETMWVSSLITHKLHAYALSTKARNLDKDIDLSAEFLFPFVGPDGLWSDGETMWVVDNSTNTLFAYKLTPDADFGDRDSGKDIALAADNVNSWGIWSDGTTMWVSDQSWVSEQDSGRVRAYNLSTKARDSGKDITLAVDNFTPWGIWSDGTTMWVVDRVGDKLYAYNLSTKARDSAKDINLPSDNTFASGIWSDGETMWVTDLQKDKIFAYSISATLVAAP